MSGEHMCEDVAAVAQEVFAGILTTFHLSGSRSSSRFAGFSYADFQNDVDARQKLEKLWYYFEFLGVMVNQSYVAEDIIFDQQGAFISGIWDKTSHLVYERRKDRNSPQYLENFEILRNRFVRWAKKHRPKLTKSQPRQAHGYYGAESMELMR